MERGDASRSPTERLRSAVTRHSRSTIAVMLVLTLVLGGGVGALEESASLDQFETASPEADALERVDDTFGSDDNTTTAQIVVRDDDALSKASLLDTLELQRALHDDENVNDTLAEEPFEDLASVVARTAILKERGGELATDADELEAEADDLEQRGEELERRGEELEAEKAALEAEADELEAEKETLEADAEELEQRGEELEADKEALEADAEELEQRGEELEADAEELEEKAESFEIPPSEAAERKEALEAREEELRAEEEALEERAADLEQRGEELEADKEALEERAADLEQRGEKLEERAADLEQRGEKLEAQADALEADKEALEARADALEADADGLDDVDPSLDEQREQLESMNQSEIDDVLETVLGGEEGSNSALVFVPSDYDPASQQADARTLFVTQVSDEREQMGGDASEEITDAQLAMASVVDDRYGDDGFVFGGGIITDEIDRSMVDSFAIVLPLALLFVTLVLTLAYRDALDILLGVFGILVVLVWTFGFMGWAGIEFNQIMIAVPVLLVGLSVDYAIHVFMRHRERRAESGDGSRAAMRAGLAGVGVALVWVTATAAIGFLSNLVSPIGPIREFGIVNAFGIVSALVVFTLFVPALKVELDDTLERRGIDRQKQAFGTGGGAIQRFLSGGKQLANATPWGVVVVALCLTSGGVVGAAQLDTSFEQEDFIADEPPEWTNELPEPFEPGSYAAKSNLEFVNDRFTRQDTRVQLLIEGDVTDDDVLERIDETETDAASKSAIATLPDGSADATSPLTVMDDVAAENETFNETYVAADTTGDGVPNENVEQLYDALYEADSDRAETVVNREDGEYEALLLAVSSRGDASSDDVTAQARSLAAGLDGDGLEVTATGQLVVFDIVEGELFETVVESLVITLLAVFAFLMVGYRRIHDSASLGFVALLPILLTVAWILGTMALLDIPFNVMTGTITSLTVGLGIAYNIHMTERYVLELKRGNDVTEAIGASVTGTGGALLGSAATTAGGFGVLAFAILPSLQQFGLITAITIIYAFLGSVFLLPSLLVLWTRYVSFMSMAARRKTVSYVTPATPKSDREIRLPRESGRAAGPLRDDVADLFEFHEKFAAEKRADGSGHDRLDD